MTDIAIVGMDCRFPGADNLGELWELLMSGGDGIGEVPPARWRADDFFDAGGGPGTTNTRSAGFITDPDVFDHEFFGISDEAAATADPQARLLLHTAWRALEDGCLDPRRQAGSRTGVYVGIMGSDWLSLVMTDFPGMNRHVPGGNGYAMMANRISYELDLCGPSMAIDTFCSSSLVATQYACAALRSGETDQALVGGVNLFVTPATNIVITQCGLSSPDGRCKPFSRDANGFGRAEGVAVVVLRRLADAVADGLPVYAIIREGAVNHGGRASTVTAPNPRAQREVIAEAYRRAGVRPADVAFVEAHGSGTIVGDRMEVRALGGVHGVPRERPCAIGSIKGNISHAEGAAGIAGLIKTALALHHGVVPPSCYADTENPRLRMAAGGLALLSAPLKLPGGEVIAGVSSFGLGGTNAHLVLGSAPARERSPARWGEGLLTVSSNSVPGLRTALRALATDLAAPSADAAPNLCWTSNMVKSSGAVRFALPVTDAAEARAGIGAALAGEERPAELSGRRDGPVRTGWLVPGEETVYAGMSAELHARCAPYRRALAKVDEAMSPSLGGSVRDLLFRGDDAVQRPGPALFAVGCALGLTLRELGVEPAWVFGEGAGECVAAVLAGFVDLAEGCRLATAGERPAGFGPPDLGGHTHLVELGPGPAPMPAVVAEAGGRMVPCPVPAGGEVTGGELLEALAVLYRDGADLSWAQLYEPDQRILHRLTPYEFATSARFWTHATVSGREIGAAG